MLPFGPYRPDIAETNPAMSQRVINVNPRKDSSGISYHPRQSLAVLSTSEALPDPCRGALAVVTRGGAFKGYFGTTSDLYSLDADYGFTSIGTGFAVPTGQDWGMCQYGEKLLVTNTFDGMHEWDIESGGTVDLITTAPKARVIFLAFECVFALDCDGDNRVMRNSAPGSYTNFQTRGAGAQEFADGEALMGGGLLNEGTATVLQKSAVSILTVTGNALIYRKDKIADGIGAVSPRSIVQAPGALYFFDPGGFYRVSAAGLEAIGQDRVNRSFIEGLAAESQPLLQGAYDPVRRQVAWRYQSEGVGSEEVFENTIVFDIATGEFVEVVEQTTILVKMSSIAYTLEDLDSLGDLDSLPYSLDSDVWKGGRPSLAALDGDRKFGFFNGANLAASVDTATLTNTKSMLVSRALPVTDAANVSLTLGVRDRLADAVQWKPAKQMQASGRVPLRGRGKAVTLRAEIEAGEDWSYLRGIDEIEMTLGGGR